MNSGKVNMPNADTHVPVGLMAGGLAGYTSAPKDVPGLDRLIETLGGLLGGYIGARLPDIIDPPTNPNHRDIAHGAVNAILAGRMYLKRLPAWQKEFRDKAAHYQARSELEENGFRKFLYALMSVFCLSIAGVLAGIIAGYSSHLILDFQTPKGLSLFCRSF